MQGENLSHQNSVITELKHFWIHSVLKAGNSMVPVFISKLETQLIFLYLFEKSVRKGSAEGIMACYH
jgi:hypothetical protein